MIKKLYQNNFKDLFITNIKVVDNKIVFIKVLLYSFELIYFLAVLKNYHYVFKIKKNQCKEISPCNLVLAFHKQP